ncbi:MAG TPA: type II CAAX endopeptidase family protein [Solirubrobacteraceae bacterium]|nr:type II CAAX endopeptidase family protein [Solirubrobacteraceae bacterium]
MAASAAPVLHRSGSSVSAAVPHRRRVARWSPPVALAAVVLGLVAGQAVSLALVFGLGGDEPGVVDGIGLIAADVVLIAVIVLFARRGARLSAGTLGIRRTRFWPAVGWACAFFAATIALQGVWTLLVGPGDEVSGGGGGATGPPSAIVIALVMFGVAVAAPIGEEIAFRGYLFAALTTWRGPWPAALITGLLFGAAHVAVYPPELLPALAFFGIAACLLFWFTGSLLPCIAVHAFNNAIAMGTLAGWDWQIPLVVIGAVTLSVVLMLPFARERAPQAVRS